MLDLEPINKRAREAVEGPWRTFPNPTRDDGVFVAQDIPPEAYPHVTKANGSPYIPAVPRRAWCIGIQIEPKTAEFIAHARADIPALIKEIEELRLRESMLTEALEFYRQGA